jgi:hypothetical protein
MRKILVVLGTAVVLGAAVPAQASPILIGAAPNPAAVGQRVVHSVAVGAPERLDVWVSAVGFGRPGFGTLPTGSWSLECCPVQTSGTAAWHYRSTVIAQPGNYRFGVDAAHPGTYRSTARIATSSASILVRLI